MPDQAKAGRRKSVDVDAWPYDNGEAVAALMLYTGPIENRDWDWFEAVGVVETILRHQIADELRSPEHRSAP